MTQDKDFKKALDIIIGWESKDYSNHSWDPGGATKYGITKATLSAYRKTWVTDNDVKNLTEAEAQRIYYEMYWLAAYCNKLPTGLNIAVFDCAVNQGVGRATRTLQAASRVKQDGIIGSGTLSKINTKTDDEILLDFMARRLLHYSSLGKLFTVAGRGWFRRTLDVYAQCRNLLT